MTIETAMTIVAVIREDTNDATTTDWVQLGSFTACACIFFTNLSTVIHSIQCHVNLQDVAGFRVVVLLICMSRATTQEFPSTAQVYCPSSPSSNCLMMSMDLRLGTLLPLESSIDS